MANLKPLVGTLAGLLLILIIFYIIVLFSVIHTLYKDFQDFITYMENEFTILYTDIETAVVNFFDVLVSDVDNLINSTFG
jgi:hypothetical protein